MANFLNLAAMSKTIYSSNGMSVVIEDKTVNMNFTPAFDKMSGEAQNRTIDEARIALQTYFHRPK